MEVGINVEGGIFWKKLVYKCNKRGGWKCAWRVEFFFKINKRDSMFIREMRVAKYSALAKCKKLNFGHALSEKEFFFALPS